MKRIVILGSTGSIGKNALSVVENLPEHFEIVGLSANIGIDLLEEQIKRWSPEVVAVVDEGKAEKLKGRIAKSKTEILCGRDSLVKVATWEGCDLVLFAIVGSHALIPALEAIRCGRVVALASKEPVVMAGEILLKEAKRCGATLLPVDSEPNAIFQCLRGEDRKEVKKLILTASGGPFLGWKEDALTSVTLESTLKHPTWKMGKKISVDSATLMNKGLEVIEAHHLFGIPVSQIDVVVHPQSIVHSLVEFVDGSVLAMLGITDMRIPIQHVLTYPERVPSPLPSLDFTELVPLSFQKPDYETFPCLKYAYRAGEVGGTLPAALNAANEVAVEEFLQGSLKFLDIGRVCKEVGERHESEVVDKPTIDDVLKIDAWARQVAVELCSNLGGQG